MERGFKARCEQMARSLRVAIGLTAIDPLSPEALASYLNVHVLSLNDVGVSNDDLRQLLDVDPESWSAITVSGYGREAIIPNPAQMNGRHASNVMHELAHLILGHKPTTVFFLENADLALRGYDPHIEEEASWLAGALLLPRDALASCKRRGLPEAEVCDIYGVSPQMLKFRLGVTGVNRQFQRRRRRQPP